VVISSAATEARSGSLRDRYLRSLFVAGALAVIRYAKILSARSPAHSAAEAASDRYSRAENTCS
jgi:hypothetical protein